MNKDIANLALFIGLCFIGYVVFIRFNVVEGMAHGPDNKPSDSSSDSSSSSSGVAGNAATFAANLKAASVKLGDTLLVSKYRSDYESAIMNAEELVSMIMLKTVLSINTSDPQESLKKLIALSHAQEALNMVMKFVDSQ
jgi:hypothetical protein